MDNHSNQYEATEKDYNKRLMGNITRLPLIIDTASGSELHDAEHGKNIHDYWGEGGVYSLGYNSPEFIHAMLAFLSSGQANRIPDIYPSETRWKAAEVICSRTGMDRIFFANSGTEAVESAIKLVRKYWWDVEGGDSKKPTPKRHVILTVEGNFHGRTGFSMAASDCRTSPYHRWGFGPMPKGFGVLDQVNDFSKVSFKQSVTDGESHEAKEPKWDEVAAIILAPVLGNNTIKTYKPAFWAELKHIRDEYGVLLIFDDIQTGSGRTGQFATWQDPSVGVKPDVMMLAKGIAMGFPMGVMLAREEIAKAFTPGVHFTTFGGGLMLCHLAITLYEWLDKHLPEVRTKGQMIRDAFAEMKWIASYDGLGMFNAFKPDFEKHGYNGFAFAHEARELGLSLVTHRAMNSLHFTPPLNTPVEEIRQMLGVMEVAHRRLVTK